MSILQVGPFAKAEEFARSFTYGLSRAYAFEQLLKEMDELEKIINSMENMEEVALAKIVYEKLEEQLNIMISHPGIQKNERSGNNPGNQVS